MLVLADLATSLDNTGLKPSQWPTCMFITMLFLCPTPSPHSGRCLQQPTDRKMTSVSPSKRNSGIASVSSHQGRVSSPATPLDYSFMGLSSLSEMLEHDPVAGKKKGCGATTARVLTASSAQSPTDETETNSSPTKPKQPTALSLRANNNKIASLNDMDDALAAVFDHPTRLQWLDLSGNALTSIPSATFAQYPDIFTLQLHGNKLSKYSDIDNIAKYLTKLHSLTLHGNPIEEKKHYKSYVIASFPQLKQLDFSCVTKGDREKAETWAKIYKQAVQNARERTGRGHQDGTSEYD